MKLWPRFDSAVDHPFRRLATVLLLAAIGCLPGRVQAQEASADIYRFLDQGLADSPEDASNHRLMGLWQIQAGNLPDAELSLRKAVDLAPDNAAAHYSLGSCLLAQQRSPEAAHHFWQAIQLAPHSSYAARARQELDRLPESDLVLPAAFEIERFDHSDFANKLLNLPREPSERLYLALDVSALYNSNVALAPTSREFIQQQASAQGILNPYVEYLAIDSESFRVGTMFNGYFTLNEQATLGALNLQSYQPGGYIERIVQGDARVWVRRAQYEYTLDEFDGRRYAGRHTATLSFTGLEPQGHTLVGYWASDYSSFANDGQNPDVSSRDGWTHRSGVSRSWAVQHALLDRVVTGIEGQWADVVGSDFRYLGFNLFLSGRVCLTESITAELDGGWGLRDYYGATRVPSRNETLWRAAGRIRKQWNPCWSTTALVNFDQFASPNNLFEADRFMAGVMMGYER